MPRNVINNHSEETPSLLPPRGGKKRVRNPGRSKARRVLRKDFSDLEAPQHQRTGTATGSRKVAKGRDGADHTHLRNRREKNLTGDEKLNAMCDYMWLKPSSSLV